MSGADFNSALIKDKFVPGAGMCFNKVVAGPQFDFILFITGTSCVGLSASIRK